MLNVIKEALTFDDVLIMPSYSNILPSKTKISTMLTNKIRINIPIVSAAMDTVTESSLAIALAKEGGIGFIHKNMSIESQIKEVKKVKEHKNGIIDNPKCVSPDMMLSELKNLTLKNGFAGYPVVSAQNELIGIITSRDVRFIKDLHQKVSSFMTPRKKLLTVKLEESKKSVLKKMEIKKVKKALVVSDNFKLIGLIIAKDFKKKEKNLYACKDKFGRLRVGAAVGTTNILENNNRIDELVKAEVDVLLIDSSHGHSLNVLKTIKSTRKKYPDLQIIAGNIATKSGALALVKAGVNAVKVGIGPGSICTTRIVTGVGVPQITAISEVAEALKNTDIKIIADGGIRFSGDIAKAIVAGAHCVMIGSILAGTSESPGDIELFQGKLFKSYRGMGSIAAMSRGSCDRYFQNTNKNDKLVPEGIEGIVPYKGKLRDVIYQQIGGLRSCMGLTGCLSIKDLRTKAKFIKVSPSSIKENHVHSVKIVKYPSNYNID